MRRCRPQTLLPLAGGLTLLALLLTNSSTLTSLWGGGLCGALKSLGDLADWVARDNESAVCRDAEATPIFRPLPDGGYPLCRLARPPAWLELRLRASSVRTWASVGPARVPVFGHRGDAIADRLTREHAWETELVRPLLARLARLGGPGNATLLDVGCNVGVYTLPAAALGFPVVAVDANARNLLLVGLALREPELAGAEARVQLLWSFITGGGAAAKRLARLNFPADCNIGGATRFARDVADPVPVMPASGGDFARLVATRLVLVKLDVEGGEADFLRTAGRLFDGANVTVVAVQMEWLKHHLTGTDAADIVAFFTDRGYSLHPVDGAGRFDIDRPDLWPENVLWLHKDYGWLQ